MGNYILGAIFFCLLALNVGAYVYFVVEIDGSTVKSSRHVVPSRVPDSGPPTR